MSNLRFFPSLRGKNKTQLSAVEEHTCAPTRFSFETLTMGEVEVFVQKCWAPFSQFLYVTIFVNQEKEAWGVFMTKLRLQKCSMLFAFLCSASILNLSELQSATIALKSFQLSGSGMDSIQKAHMYLNPVWFTHVSGNLNCMG